MTDQTPATEAGRRWYATDHTDAALRAILAIEDEVLLGEAAVERDVKAYELGRADERERLAGAVRAEVGTDNIEPNHGAGPDYYVGFDAGLLRAIALLQPDTGSES